MKMIHRGEKGFTLIELLVVIAILGVIAAVVALNVAGFFGRGTLQAANTELHQAQTAIISAMADAENNVVGTRDGDSEATVDILTDGEVREWAGEAHMVLIQGPLDENEDRIWYDASEYVYGPFRATYTVDHSGAIILGECDYDGGWGPNIFWSINDNWTDDVTKTPGYVPPVNG